LTVNTVCLARLRSRCVTSLCGSACLIICSGLTCRSIPRGGSGLFLAFWSWRGDEDGVFTGVFVGSCLLFLFRRRRLFVIIIRMRFRWLSYPRDRRWLQGKNM
jgi:hypothetical protein